MSSDDTRLLERAVVGGLIDHPEFIGYFLERIEVHFLSSTAFFVAQALADLVTDAEPVTVQTVMERMRTRGELPLAGGGPALFEVWSEGQRSFDPEGEIDILAGRYALREAHEVGQRLIQGVDTMAPEAWVSWAESEVDRVRQMAAGSPTVFTYLRDRLVGEDVSVQWCVPGLIPLGTATMLTAEEGVGKSVVLRQIAMAAMAGLDPFAPQNAPYEPQRVVLIDCEVTSNQLTRSLRALWSYCRPFAPDADTTFMAVESHQGGLNFSEPHDQGWLHRMVRGHKADLVVVGPVYRFTDSDLNTEEGVRSWQRAFEPLLAEGVSVVTEHHAPNEHTGHVRMLRPIGSSAMRRWFAQGISLRTQECAIHNYKFCPTCPRSASVESWRGSRDEEARWPRYLRGERGHVWWVTDEEQEVRGSRNI